MVQTQRFRGVLTLSQNMVKTATYSAGYLTGYCKAAVVVRYVDSDPEHHHLPEMEIVKRACKEAWPDLNKHVFVSR
jgi:hypothetical protein